MRRYESWFKQAKNEYLWGQVSLEAGFFAQACFIAQQVAEKSLKSIAYFRKAIAVKSHSISTICDELKINGELKDFGQHLDLYYVSTRYPDALPDHAVPAESFSKKQAIEALKMAKVFLDRAEEEIKL